MLLGATLLAMTAPLFAQQAEDPFKATYEWRGKALPTVSLTMLDGKTWTNKDLQGKVVLIDVFATWCGPCRAAAPTLQKWSDEFKGKGVIVLGVNAGERDDAGKPISAEAYAKKTQDYVNEHKYTYTFATNGDAVKSSLSVRAFPSFFVVDRKGNIREISVGFNEKLLHDTIAKLAASN